MKRVSLFGLLAASLCFSAACSQDMKSSPISGSTTTESKTPKSAITIHEHALVLDAHADIEIPGHESRYVGKDGLSQVSPEKMRAGGVDAVVMAIAVSPGPRNEQGYAQARARADEELAAVLAMTQDPSDDLVLARSADDLVTAHAEGKRALILGFQNARILGRDVSALDEFYAAGVRVFALTHMGHNDFADSSRPPSSPTWAHTNQKKNTAACPTWESERSSGSISWADWSTFPSSRRPRRCKSSRSRQRPSSRVIQTCDNSRT